MKIKLVLTIFLFNAGYSYTSAQCWKAISATGSQHNLAIKEDGTLWAWGVYWTGALGTNGAGDYKTPTQVGTDSDWVLICAGYNNSLAQKRNGELWGWGENRYGELGNGTLVSSGSPALINTINNLTSLSGPALYKQATRSEGALWAWGYNEHGELGDGTFQTKTLPVQIGEDNVWSNVSASDFHTLAIKSDGTIWGWGSGIEGELGDNIPSMYVAAPFHIFTGNNWKVVAAGTHHSLAIKHNGTLWAWGYNGNGQLGDGTHTVYRYPIQVGTDSNWLSVMANGYNSFAIKKDSSLWAWGHNNYGQLGDGTTTDKTIPVKIGSFTNWKMVMPGAEHTLALRSDNTMWSWGGNFSGQLGDGTTISKLTPVQIPCINTLPVVLSFFNLQKKNNRILLNWKTSSEINCKEFKIERSTDGIEFRSVGTILSRNNAAGDSYIFIDTKPLKEHNYYRLKFIDIDGQYTYSPIKTISFTPSVPEACIYPNPVKDKLTIECSLSGEEATIIVTDVEGRKIWESIKLNTSHQEIQTTYLKPGIYIVTIISNSTKITRKILKQ